jgi:hypothetical protein
MDLNKGLFLKQASLLSLTICYINAILLTIANVQIAAVEGNLRPIFIAIQNVTS